MVGALDAGVRTSGGSRGCGCGCGRGPIADGSCRAKGGRVRRRENTVVNANKMSSGGSCASGVSIVEREAGEGNVGRF